MRRKNKNNEKNEEEPKEKAESDEKKEGIEEESWKSVSAALLEKEKPPAPVSFEALKAEVETTPPTDIGRELEIELRWLKNIIELRMKKREDDLRERLESEFDKRLTDTRRRYEDELREREEFLKKQLGEEYKKKEEDARRDWELEARRKEEELRTKLEFEHRKREDEIKRTMELEGKKREEDLKARLEFEHKKREEELKKELEEKARFREEELSKRLEEEIKKRVEERAKFVPYRLSIKEAPYPFTAIVGQERLKRALILNAINPAIGGVLLWGPRGNAKTTAIIGLAKLIAPEEKQIKMPAMAEAGAEAEAEAPSSFYIMGLEEKEKIKAKSEEELASEWWNETRYLTGTITAHESPVSYIYDPVNNVAAISQLTVGIEESKRPFFVLDKTKVEDEKILHLLNDMTLHVEVKGLDEIGLRTEVMRRQKEYSRDPAKFYEKYKSDEESLRDKIMKARQMLPLVTLSTKLSSTIAKMCMFDKRGSRVDILLEELARTNAAYDGRTHVTPDDVEEAADMILLHRVKEKKETAIKPLTTEEE